MPEASPAKWHLAHTTWFFDTFAVERRGIEKADQRAIFGYLFNSYYDAAGERYPRHLRGLLTRPSREEVLAYRARVDEKVLELLAHSPTTEQLAVLELGIHHEQQHQELLLTDLLSLFAQSPLSPCYAERNSSGFSGCEQRFDPYPGGLSEVGHDGAGFAFDNEGPRHRVYLEPFELSTRLVTNGEYYEFVADGGYRRPELWLSDGWATSQRSGWERPLYHRGSSTEQLQYSLHGELPIHPSAPVCHVSYYEADAYARWANARLPSEAEWESAAQASLLAAPVGEPQFYQPSELLPRPTGSLLGSLWVWTCSAYAAYPGFVPTPGALGEYNGKFMCNQMVLRGGSCLTPEGHARPSYRNFFYPDARWQMSGIRLAR